MITVIVLFVVFRLHLAGMPDNSHDNSVFRLKGCEQNYDWGKTGSSSIVAKFLREAVGENSIVENKAYAEVYVYQDAVI